MSKPRRPAAGPVSHGPGPGARPGDGRAAFSAANSNTRILGPRSFVLPTPAARQAADAGAAPANLGLNSERQRHAMVQRLRAQGITDERVLAAMMAVPRHVFVDQGLASRAYDDAALPIGYGQTISQPWVVAHMIEAMVRGRTPQKVLEIGAGCGYQAAVLAQFIPVVHAVERVRGLYELASKHLKSLALPGRVHLSYGDGMAGLARHAPFEGIVVAAAGVKIPEVLFDQLAVGARLIAPEGSTHQRLMLIERTGPESWQRTELESVRFVPLRPGTQA
ncbi:protein-L-isoaspartate(D-aspartate) O-methyltransferase [Castellaniella sp.]|uniref:protein-L-isoaspartate(D-aspartate) O-methyltransferase n=1 Tax=Castellaniella sp. TaxID=1955812 RepID=UPI00356268FB